MSMVTRRLFFIEGQLYIGGTPIKRIPYRGGNSYVGVPMYCRSLVQGNTHIMSTPIQENLCTEDSCIQVHLYRGTIIQRVPYIEVLGLWDLLYRASLHRHTPKQGHLHTEGSPYKFLNGARRQLGSGYWLLQVLLVLRICSRFCWNLLGFDKIVRGQETGNRTRD